MNVRRIARLVLLRALVEVIGLVIIACWLPILWQVIVIGLADGPVSLVAAAAGGIAGGLAAIALHEVGHAVAGWLAGVPARSLVVGLVRVDWDGGRPRVVVNTRLFRPAAVMYPEAVETTVRRWSVVVAAGPAASLVVGLACLAGAAAINPGPTDVPVARTSRWRDVAVVWPGNAGVAALNVTGLFSLYLGVASLVPGRVGRLRSDGGHLLDAALGRWPPTPPESAGHSLGGRGDGPGAPAGGDPAPTPAAGPPDDG